MSNVFTHSVLCFAAGKKWIAGSSISLADVSGFCLLLGYFEKSVEANEREQIPNVMRWFEACLAEQGFELVGQVCYCTKEKVGGRRWRLCV